MHEQNIKILKDSFPTVYADNFYFECGDGWMELLLDIGSFIAKRSSDCKAEQVKEKFGSLRFYVSFEYNEIGISDTPLEVINEIYDYISLVEEKSKKLCEDCGIDLDDNNRFKQKNNKYTWIRNICQKCGAEEKKSWSQK